MNTSSHKDNLLYNQFDIELKTLNIDSNNDTNFNILKNIQLQNYYKNYSNNNADIYDNEMNNKNDELNNEYKLIDNKNDELNNECKLIDNKNDELNNECKLIDNKNDELNNECKLIDNKNDELNNECKLIDNKNDELNNECKLIDNKNDELNNECKLIDNKNDELNNEYKLIDNKNVFEYKNILNENLNQIKNILLEVKDSKKIFDDIINKIKLLKMITEFQYIIDNFDVTDDEFDIDIDDTSKVLETNQLWNIKSNIIKLTCDGWKGYKIRAYTKSKKIPDEINKLPLECKKYYSNLYNKCFEIYVNNFNFIDLENMLYAHMKTKFNL